MNNISNLKFFEEQAFYGNLTYATRKVTEQLIYNKKILNNTKTGRKYTYVCTILVGTYFLILNISDRVYIMFILFMLLFAINIIDTVTSPKNKSFDNSRKSIRELLKGDFCNCSSKCMCKDRYIKFMDKELHIKLY